MMMVGGVLVVGSVVVSGLVLLQDSFARREPWGWGSAGPSCCVAGARAGTVAHTSTHPPRAVMECGFNYLRADSPHFNFQAFSSRLG